MDSSLLKDIQCGKKLRKTKTNDRSAPILNQTKAKPNVNKLNIVTDEGNIEKKKINQKSGLFSEGFPTLRKTNSPFLKQTKKDEEKNKNDFLFKKNQQDKIEIKKTIPENKQQTNFQNLQQKTQRAFKQFPENNTQPESFLSHKKEEERNLFKFKKNNFEKKQENLNLPPPRPFQKIPKTYKSQSIDENFINSQSVNRQPINIQQIKKPSINNKPNINQTIKKPSINRPSINKQINNKDDDIIQLERRLKIAIENEDFELCVLLKRTIEKLKLYQGL